jgi:hypothetical protein
VWRQKLKRAGCASGVRSAICGGREPFDKLKVLFDEIETEWADSQQTSRPRALMKTRQLPSSVDVCACNA